MFNNKGLGQEAVKAAWIYVYILVNVFLIIHDNTISGNVFLIIQDNTISGNVFLIIQDNTNSKNVFPIIQNYKLSRMCFYNSELHYFGERVPCNLGFHYF